MITEYFQALEADVSERPYIVESALVKDQRSLYIGHKHTRDNLVVESMHPSLARVLNEIEDMIPDNNQTSQPANS